jgi:hypothetical protein
MVKLPCVYTMTHYMLQGKYLFVGSVPGHPAQNVKKYSQTDNLDSTAQGFT